jgi:hypothetical protein
VSSGSCPRIGELTGAAADRLRGHGGEPLAARRMTGGDPLAGWGISPVVVVSRSLGGVSERLTTGE